MRFSEAMLIAGTVTSICASIGLMTSAVLSSQSGAATAVDDTANRWFPAADHRVSARVQEARSERAAAALLAQMMHQSPAAKVQH